MGYRIIVKTERSGKKQYFVQKRFMWYFWRYLRQCYDISMYAYKIYFDSLEGAKERIQQEVNDDYARHQSKIVKREVVV